MKLSKDSQLSSSEYSKNESNRPLGQIVDQLKVQDSDILFASRSISNNVPKIKTSIIIKNDSSNLKP
jgi:hypothetical protein